MATTPNKDTNAGNADELGDEAEVSRSSQRSPTDVSEPELGGSETAASSGALSRRSLRQAFEEAGFGDDEDTATSGVSSAFETGNADEAARSGAGPSLALGSALLPDPSIPVAEVPEADEAAPGEPGEELLGALRQLHDTLDESQWVLTEDHVVATQASMERAAVPPELESSRRKPRSPAIWVLSIAAVLALAGAIALGFSWRLTDRQPSSLQAKDERRLKENLIERKVGAQWSGRSDEALKKLVMAATASLDPNAPTAAPKFSVEPAAGEAGRPIPLAIVLPTGALSANATVLVQGVPNEVRMSAGRAVGGGTWVLSGPDIDGLTLSTPKTFAGPEIKLMVLVLLGDGKPPSMQKLIVTVEPAAVSGATPDEPPAGKAVTSTAAEPPSEAKPAATDTQPSVPPLSDTDKARHMGRGNALMSQGDIAGARLIFEYAARRGVVDAMVALGKSYDPDYLPRLGIQGIKPDVGKAVHWYRQAAENGSAQSHARAAALAERQPR